MNFSLTPEEVSERFEPIRNRLAIYRETYLLAVKLSIYLIWTAGMIFGVIGSLVRYRWNQAALDYMITNTAIIPCMEIFMRLSPASS